MKRALYATIDNKKGCCIITAVIEEVKTLLKSDFYNPYSGRIRFDNLPDPETLGKIVDICKKHGYSIQFGDSDIDTANLLVLNMEMYGTDLDVLREKGLW